MNKNNVKKVVVFENINNNIECKCYIPYKQYKIYILENVLLEEKEKEALVSILEELNMYKNTNINIIDKTMI